MLSYIQDSLEGFLIALGSLLSLAQGHKLPFSP